MPVKTRNTSVEVLKEIDNLSPDGKMIVSVLSDKLDLFKDEFLNLLKVRDAEIHKLNKQVIDLQAEIHKLKENVDDGDAYERRDTVIFSGEELPLVSAGEIPTNVAVQVIKDKLNLNIPPTDISTSHRLGKTPSSQQPDRRNIIIKFCRRDTKHNVLAMCRKKKPSKFYVNESLTPTRSTVLYALRKMKRENGSRVTGTSTRDGKVYAWIKQSSSAPPGSPGVMVPVNSHHALLEFSMKYMGKPLGNYIETWTH